MTQSILDVRGIGPAMQVVLKKQGFKTIEDLANTTVEKLSITPGISEIKATQIIADARNLEAIVIPDEDVASTKNKKKDKKSAKKSKKDKKDKKDKKSKKSKKSKKDKKDKKNPSKK